MAGLALPLAAAEPLAKSPARIVPASSVQFEAEYPPPAPLAPLPQGGSLSGAPTTIYSQPGYSQPGYTVPPAPAPYASYSSTGSSYGPPTSYYTAQGSGAAAIYGTPGGYEARIGSPYHYFDPSGGQYVTTGNPYTDHFGPGYHRHSLHGHYRFPYYNYRAPWYYPGRAVYNRDTNFAW